MGVAQAAPQTSWYLDELGNISASYTLDDNLGSNDGTANLTQYRKRFR